MSENNANSVDPDQKEWGIWSGSTLFAIVPLFATLKWVKKTICMKYQSRFWEKGKKYFKMSSAEFLGSMLSIKIHCFLTTPYFLKIDILLSRNV